MVQYQDSPAVIIHEGAVHWLIYMLSQIRISNPHMKIFLIGDKKALRFIPDGVTGVDINLHSEEADHFTELYHNQHKSFNSFWFENLCFRRSFILADFMKKNNIFSCWHIDSDNMIYTNLNNELNRFPAYCKFAANGDETVLSPHNSFWTLEILLQYNIFAMKCITKGTPENQMMEKYWVDWQKNNTVGGISDMTTLTFFAKYNSESFYFLNGTEYENWNITLSSSFPELQARHLLFFTNRIRKEADFFLLDGKKMLNIHCQGFTKRFISKFYTGKDKTALFLKTLCFRPRRIAAYIYHIILKF